MESIREASKTVLERGDSQLIPSFLGTWLFCGLLYFTCTLPTFYNVFGLLLTIILLTGWAIGIWFIISFKYNPIRKFISSFKNVQYYFYLKLLRVVTFSLCVILATNPTVVKEYDFSVIIADEDNLFSEALDYMQPLFPAPYKDILQVACDTLSVVYEMSEELIVLSEEYRDDVPTDILKEVSTRYQEKIEPQEYNLEVAKRSSNLFTFFIILDILLYSLTNFLLNRKFKKGGLT